ncbi:196_t:CDS:1, partial [Cetraspora pellucida]
LDTDKENDKLQLDTNKENDKLQLDTNKENDKLQLDTNKENDTDKKIYKYYIHVGYGHDNFINIEKLAHKDGYCLKDNDEKMPVGGVCPNYDQEEIETDVDVDRLVDHLCLKKEWKKVKRSDNAGRYLCEYTFYVSLCENAKKSIPGTVLFVHVPREGCPYSMDELVQILKDIGIWVTENY